MPKVKNDFEKKIAHAALRVAASRGWKAVTLDQIAKAAKVPVVTIKKNFKSANEILPAIIRTVTAETATHLGKPDIRASPRDRIFEVMMARFDVLQKYRKAIVSIIVESRRDSGMLCVLFPAQSQAMREMLTLAGLDKNQLKQPEWVTAAGMGAIYLAALRIWHRDETLDMARTMASLDRYLRWGEKATELAEIFFRRIG